ncbi:MAG: hypothetical protein ABIR98_08460 [Usitatibacter sp.]
MTEAQLQGLDLFGTGDAAGEIELGRLERQRREGVKLEAGVKEKLEALAERVTRS